MTHYNQHRGHTTQPLLWIANALAVLITLPAPVEAAATETVLHAFAANAPKGSGPFGLYRDAADNLYGTTYAGGRQDLGVVFMVDPKGQYSVLYDFKGNPDGAEPSGPVIGDSAGNLYGTTRVGGTAANYGAVFKLDAQRHESVLHGFSELTDGDSPQGGVVRDVAGNLYGTTTYGGKQACASGCGVVYKIDPNGNETVLHRFDGSDGVGLQGPSILTQRAIFMEQLRTAGSIPACMEDAGSFSRWMRPVTKARCIPSPGDRTAASPLRE